MFLFMNIGKPHTATAYEQIGNFRKSVAGVPILLWYGFSNISGTFSESQDMGPASWPGRVDRISPNYILLYDNRMNIVSIST